MAAEVSAPQDAVDYFLVGLFSLADCLFGVPLAEALTHVPLPADLLRSIQTDEGDAGLLVRTVRAIERGDTETVANAAADLGFAPQLAQTLYLDAARWGSECA
jgi:c-di-GMP-related signal transduction protein